MSSKHKKECCETKEVQEFNIGRQVARALRAYELPKRKRTTRLNVTSTQTILPSGMSITSFTVNQPIILTAFAYGDVESIFFNITTGPQIPSINLVGSSFTSDNTVIQLGFWTIGSIAYIQPGTLLPAVDIGITSSVEGNVALEKVEILKPIAENDLGEITYLVNIQTFTFYTI